MFKTNHLRTSSISFSEIRYTIIGLDMDGEAGNQQKAEQEGGVLDRRYYRGLLAIPKGVEVVSAMT